MKIYQLHFILLPKILDVNIIIMLKIFGKFSTHTDHVRFEPFHPYIEYLPML